MIYDLQLMSHMDAADTRVYPREALEYIVWRRLKRDEVPWLLEEIRIVAIVAKRVVPGETTYARPSLSPRSTRCS